MLELNQGNVPSIISEFPWGKNHSEAKILQKHIQDINLHVILDPPVN